MSQDESNAPEIKSIYGVWYMNDSASCGNSWVFQRDRKKEYEWGQSFEFKDNGEFVDSYSGPCGNDGFIHDWSGKWKYNKGERILFLQIENCPDYSELGLADFVKPSEDYKAGEEFFILELTRGSMRLQSKNPTVQLYV